MPKQDDRAPESARDRNVPGRMTPADMNPGDEAPPGTPGTGEAVCPVCSGSGRVSNGQCPNCGGGGIVIEGVGGA